MRTRQMSRVAVALAAVGLTAACGSYSPAGPSPAAPPGTPAPPDGGPPVLTRVVVSVMDDPIELGQTSRVTATAADQYGAPFDAGPVTYTSSAQHIAGVEPRFGQILGVSPGTVQISAEIGGKVGQASLTVVKTPIRVNEITPNGDAFGGWVELFNPAKDVVPLAGWVLAGDNLIEVFTFPADVAIPGNGYLVIDEAVLPAGLRGTDDSLHLFTRFGVQADSHFWTTSPATSFGRCPNGAGGFVITVAATRGAANAC